MLWVTHHPMAIRSHSRAFKAPFVLASAFAALFPLTGLAQRGGGSILEQFPFLSKDAQPTPEQLAKLPGVLPEKAAQLIKEVKVPEGFTATIFATPPAVNYPVFIAAAPDGTLYVSSDGNGSLDRKEHLGRVLRVRDTNGDGQADEVKAFVPDVVSPRGLVWDHDRLYLMHPPNISVFIDNDGDGVADESKVLIKGIAFDFKDRPADHSSNGLELGIDGWIYAAIGDFGFMHAEGTDGRKLQLRGGGVVRFRPDGSGLELYAMGTRNILEAAVSPLLDIFARDNTNDGGGWDVRFHHFSGLTQHGYPRLFKNFPGEFIEPLADYGGGAGCGAAWIDEPGIPAKWNNAPFTDDWGRGWVYHHGLTPDGATFKVTQEEFFRLDRVTDIDVDANSAIYAASWKGASFTWVGLDVGFLVRLTPTGYHPEPLPDFAKATPSQLVGLLDSPSARRRLEAQRTLLRRGVDKTVAAQLESVAGNSSKPLATRVAAVFALKQALGAAAIQPLVKLAANPSIAPWAIRALTDRADELKGVPAKPILAALKSTDARTRKEAVVAVGRLGDVAQAKALVPLLGDADPVISRTAVQALMRLQADDVCLAAVDSKKSSAEVRAGALQVLQTLHTPAVVDGLIARLNKETDATRREGLISALCRLHFVDGEWKGDSWGTRPDTRGPYYQPDPWNETAKIGSTLKTALDKADSKEAALIGREMALNRIPAGDAIDTLIARAEKDASLLPAIAAQLADADSVPASAVPLLARTARAQDTSDAIRAQAVIALAKTSSPDAWSAILAGYPVVQATRTENNLAAKTKSAVFGANGLDQVHAVFAEEAAKLNGDASELADVMLLRLSGRKVGAPEAREAASKALDAGWSEPKRRIQILKAAAEARDTSRAAQFVAALDDPNQDVAKAAKQTIDQLRINPDKFRAEAKAPHIQDMKVADVVAAVMMTKGDANRGEQLFTQVGCVACHTVTTDEPLKGPFLGNIASVYPRRELAEAILMPNKTIAQGFVTQHFEMKNGDEIEGFVVREAADVVTLRNVAAQEVQVKVADVAKREKLEKSLMPEGLVAPLTVSDFASLLDYLERLNKASKK
jgi:putative membrane-bound dehydrogenase-like protein